jgi:hypothetical protein
MTIDSIKDNRIRRFADKVMDTLFGKVEQLPQAAQRVDADAPGPKNTGIGTVTEMMRRWTSVFYDLSTKRKDVYTDVLEMDDTVDEIAAALDILADNAVNAEGGAQRSFWVKFDSTAPTEIQKAVDQLIERVGWHELAQSAARECLLMGDCFIQPVINGDMLIERLMEMPTRTMYRNEDAQGRLVNNPAEGHYAFYQVVPGMANEGFFPWQIEHLRWNRPWGSPYGRSLLSTARTAWRKLQAMEEALVINWLTRAFARLLFILDITGKAPDEAEQYIEAFKSKLLTKSISSGVDGSEELSVVKDIFIGRGYQDVGGKYEAGLADVKVLDTTSTGFWNLNAIEYYRGKILTSVRVPKAHLGLEKDINAKATLQLQDRRFARTVRNVQSLLSAAIDHTIKLQLVLLDYDPSEIRYSIMWPSPAWADEVDTSTAVKNYAQADDVLIKNGVITPEYAAIEHLHVAPSEWDTMKVEIKKQVAERQKAQITLAQSKPAPSAQPQPAGGNGNKGVK